MPTDDAKPVNSVQGPSAPDKILAKTETRPARKPAAKKRKPFRSRQRRFAIATVQIAVVAYAALLAILVLLETRMVYPGAFMPEQRESGTLQASIVPTSQRNVNPSNPTATQGIETVVYETTDGITLRGRLLERGPNKQLLLFFHGNGIKAARFDSWIQDWSARLDANVMAAEYRGFEDDATPTEKGVIADCLFARDFLCDRYGVSPDEIILYGNSLGGGCAVAVASRGGAKALVLDRTFDRLVDVAADKYPYFPIRWLMKNRYDSIAKLTVYHGPLIVVHGSDDTLIPIAHAKRLYDSARCDLKKWIAVPRLGHNEPLPAETTREIAETLRHVTRSVPPESREPSQPEAADLRASN